MLYRRRRKRSSWGPAAVLALRSHLEFTQRELAQELGVRQQTVSEWETGLYTPRGASITLLNIMAERARFLYEPEPVSDQEESRRDGLRPGRR